MARAPQDEFRPAWGTVVQAVRRQVGLRALKKYRSSMAREYYIAPVDQFNGSLVGQTSKIQLQRQLNYPRVASRRDRAERRTAEDHVWGIEWGRVG